MKEKYNYTYDIVRHDRRLRMDLQAVVVADLLADLLAAAGGAHFSAAAPPSASASTLRRRNRAGSPATPKPIDRNRSEIGRPIE